jgi:RHS repeat-associated protein
LATVSRNSITTTLTYNDANQMLTESYAGGTLAGLSVNNVFDNYLRRTTVEIKNGSTVLQGASYAYDVANRLQTVTDASATAYTATYAYQPNSLLLNTLTFKENSNNRLITTRSYDKLNRLSSISSTGYGTSAGTLPVSFTYQYNAANQRTRTTLGDGSYWVYQYDELGQVISGKRYWADGTPVAGQQFEYALDDIGNRDSTAVGGDASGAGLRSSSYTKNRINQYSQRTVPAYVDIMGVANPTANVTVGGNIAYRKGEYFQYALQVPNSSAAYTTVTVTSSYGAGQSDSGKVYVPPATESYGYDTDGNLTSDGRWTYGWDGENRLVQMVRDVDAPTGARQKLVFEYDHQGRRIRKQFFTYSSGWVEQTDVIYLCDGWNLVGELDANASNAKLRTYVWGLDLRATMQAAGGVGGLLKVTDYTSGTTHHFVGHDGNGNVAVLMDGSTAATTARYDYGPFGEPLRATGSQAKKNPLRFSTKYTDAESGLLYYGFRYYNPSTGRWLSRDPFDENGGLNLYAFVVNQPLILIDTHGRTPVNSVESGSAEPSSNADPTDAECSKFSWWNKPVGVTLSDCKPQLTAWGKQMPKFLQDCVMRHEKVHEKLCKDCGSGIKGWVWYGLFCACPVKYCAEQAAYSESVACAKEAMKDISQLAPDDQLALRCFLASSRSRCKAEKKECDARFRKTPGGPSCD